MTIKTFLILLTTIFIFASCKQTNKQLLDKGLDLSKEKKYAEAIKIYTQVIRNNNRLQLAYYNRGFCYFKLKDYKNALADFDSIIALHTESGYVISFSKNVLAANEEVQGQVSYNDALYERAQVNYYLDDSIQSSFNDFQLLIDNNYEEKTNCFLWQGALYIKKGKNDSACYYFDHAKQAAKSTEDKDQVNKMIIAYCLRPPATVSADSSKK